MHSFICLLVGLLQFCSPLFSFFRLVPGFVEVDESVQRFLCMWVIVTEFEAAAFDSFEKEGFCFFVITLLFVEYSQIVLGFQRLWVVLTQLALSAGECFVTQTDRLLK